MKKTLLIVLLSLGTAGTCLFGQGLNGGFETWGASFGEPTEPTGWVTANLFAAPILTFPAPNPNPTSAFQATGGDLYMGTYSLRLTSVALQYNPDTANIPDTLGIAVTGSVIMSPFSLRDRIPFTGRPSIFAFAAKYAPSVPTDSASIYVQLSRWNGSSRDIIMGIYIPINATSTYQNYSIPLSASYLMPNFPDSLSIGISSTRIMPPRRVGSTLHIDNISYSGWVGMGEYSQENVIKVFPNPATESITLDATALKADLSHAEILDVNGKLVGTVDMRNVSAVTFNAGLLPAGSYTYNLVGIQGIRVGDGKFQVSR